MTTVYPFPVSDSEFKDKRVLVTGGTKGMGEAIVRRFTLSGAAVATTARSPFTQGTKPINIRADRCRDSRRRSEGRWPDPTGVGSAGHFW